MGGVALHKVFQICEFCVHAKPFPAGSQAMYELTNSKVRTIIQPYSAPFLSHIYTFLIGTYIVVEQEELCNFIKHIGTGIHELQNKI